MAGNGAESLVTARGVAAAAAAVGLALLAEMLGPKTVPRIVGYRKTVYQIRSALTESPPRHLEPTAATQTELSGVPRTT